MPDNVAASMTASIILDKSDLLAQILKGLSEGQKELQNNKLEMYFDFSNSKNQAEFEKVIQKYRKQLSSQEFVVQIKDQGIDETVKSLDKLLEVVRSLASGKAFGTGSGNGKGIGNSIVDEEQLKTVINLFEKMESHLGSMRKVISDVGDGNEFSPLLTMINRVDSSISELAKKTSSLSLNMNLDFGSDDKMTAEVQARTAKLLHTYENLFNRLKMSGTLDSNMQGYFDNFDINQYDNMNAKIAAYKNFITEMREMSKQQFGKDYLYSDIEKSYYSAVSGAQRSLNNVIKSESTSNNSIENLFGKTDLSEVISQLTIIVNKLDEISASANNFTNVFKNGLDVNTSIQEVIDLTNRVKELETELAKIKNTTPATVSTEQKKDAIQVDNSSTTNASTSAIKEENNVLEQTAQSAEKAANSKKKFAKANKEVKDSADASKIPVKEETDALDKVTDSTNQLNVIQAKSDSTYWQNRFKESVKDMTSTNDELVKMKKYYQDMSNEAKKAYDIFERQKKSYVDKLIGYTDTSKYTSDFVNRASSLKDEVDALKFTNPQDVARLQEIDAEVIKISNDSKLLENKLIKQQSKLAEIVSQIKIFKSQNTNMSSSQKAELDQIIKYAETMQQSGKEVASEVENIKVRFAGLKAVVNEMGNTGKNFFDQIGNRLTDMNSKFVAQFLSWQDWIRYIQQAAQMVIELNTNITELAKVSEQTSKQIYADFDSYADIAKEIGGTISDTISATADWSKNGYNIPDSKQLAEISQLYKNVGDGIDITSANESLISTLKGFQLEADQAEHIVDVFNEVSNNEAISSSGIGEALQRSAASFNAANTSLEQSVALITATNTVLQDVDKTGNMWKTVSARIRGAKTEIEEMGGDTEDMVESTSKLQSLIKGMTGVDILESDGKTFKDMYTIVSGIADKWATLDDIDQAALLEALAGKQQSNALSAALQNPDILKKAYEEATNATGSARKEQEEYAKSIQYSIDVTKAKLEELANDFLSSDFLKGAIDAGGKFIDILDGIVNHVGILRTAFIGLTGYLTAKNANKLGYASI